MIDPGIDIDVTCVAIDRIGVVRCIERVVHRVDVVADPVGLGAGGVVFLGIDPAQGAPPRADSRVAWIKAVDLEHVTPFDAWPPVDAGREPFHRDSLLVA